MHYFKRNIGDYHKKAGRLSMIEHGAYTLLLDACYDRERFPTLDEALEWTWARSDEEVAAVKFVLSKFFVNVDGVFAQQRVQDEIDAFHAKSMKNKEIAIEREANRRALRERIEHETCTDGHLPTNQEPLPTNQEPSKSTCPQQADDGHKFRFAEIKDAYNRICSPTLPACRAANEARRKQVKRMVDLEFNDKRPFREHGLPMWESYFADCLKDKHWTGDNDRGWRADFDFVTNPKNAIKLLERICG